MIFSKDKLINESTIDLLEKKFFVHTIDWHLLLTDTPNNFESGIV